MSFQDKLTIKDLYELESIGVSMQDFATMQEGQMPSAAMMHAMAWLAARETNPAITLAECRSLPLSQLSALIPQLTGEPAGEPVPSFAPTTWPSSF